MIEISERRKLKTFSLLQGCEMVDKRNSFEVPELEKLLAGKKKKYVRYEEGAVLYSMDKNTFRQIAQDAHAIVRLKRIALVNVEVLDEYLESFRE